MIYEEVLLEALLIRSRTSMQRTNAKKNKYWKKIINIELKRIRKGHMTDPWLNSSMRYWKGITTWKNIRKENKND